MSLMGVCHNSLGLTMFFLVLSALFLEVRSFPLSSSSCVRARCMLKSLLLVPAHKCA